MFFALPNLSSQVVRRIPEPWSEAPAPAEKLALPKDKFREWSADPSTSHTYFSMVEGLDPMRRTSDKGENPPVIIHGFVGDFDSDIADDRRTKEYLLSRKKGDFLPNYVSRSHSGGVHAVWMFENPIKVASPEMAYAVLAQIASRLKAAAFYPNLGKESADPYQYFELGTDWKQITDERIPDNHVWHWVYEAGDKLKFSLDLRETAIPMDKVAERVEELFPGKWDGGKFELGARGRAFWVEDSATLRCAIVREGGMQCFLSSQPPFVPWSKILGVKWCEQFHADRIGAVIKDFWFEETSRNYWELDVKAAHPKAFNYSEKHMERMLRVTYGITRQKSTSSDSTELENVMERITTEKRFDAIGYFIYRPVGLMHLADKKYLNVSTVRVLPPAPKGDKPLAWGEGFPFIATLLQSLFRTPDHMAKTGLNQLEHFLSWLKYAYCGALMQNPQPGQVCFLCGPQDIGKTFLVDKILAPLLAGTGAVAEPCEDYAFGHTEFNANLARSPVWKIDDKKPKGPNEHNHYSTFIKVTAADATLRVRQMRTDPAKTTWPGRLFVLMNMDPSSAVLLPSTEASMLQKMNLFLCQANPKFKFPSRNTGDRLVAEQLPMFARFLYEWRIPAHCVTTGKNVRFGVNTYHDTEVRRLAFEQGTTFGFFEYLQIFLANYKKVNPEAKAWSGTAGQLSVEMGEVLGRSRDLSSTGVGRNLSILQSRGAGLSQKHTGQARVWTIPVDLIAPEDVDDGADIARTTDQKLDASVDAMQRRLDEMEASGLIPTSEPVDCDYHAIEMAEKNEQPVTPVKESEGEEDAEPNTSH